MSEEYIYKYIVFLFFSTEGELDVVLIAVFVYSLSTYQPLYPSLLLSPLCQETLQRVSEWVDEIICICPSLDASQSTNLNISLSLLLSLYLSSPLCPRTLQRVNYNLILL